MLIVVRSLRSRLYTLMITCTFLPSLLSYLFSQLLALLCGIYTFSKSVIILVFVTFPTTPSYLKQMSNHLAFVTFPMTCALSESHVWQADFRWKGQCPFALAQHTEKSWKIFFQTFRAGMLFFSKADFSLSISTLWRPGKFWSKCRLSKRKLCYCWGGKICNMAQQDLERKCSVFYFVFKVYWSTEGQGSRTA